MPQSRFPAQDARSRVPLLLDVPKLNGRLAIIATSDDHVYLTDDPRPRKPTRPYEGATVVTPEGGRAKIASVWREFAWLDDRDERVEMASLELPPSNLPDDYWQDPSIGYLTTRGVTYHVSAHMHRWADGSWNIGPEPDGRNAHLYFAKVHATRADMRDASVAAIRTMNEAVLAAFREWVETDAARELLANAGDAKRGADIDRKRAEVAKAREALAELERELAEMEAS